MLNNEKGPEKIPDAVKDELSAGKLEDELIPKGNNTDPDKVLGIVLDKTLDPM